jgi:hypothetical protein
MNKEAMIEVGKNFVELHKDSDITRWDTGSYYDGDDAYLCVYDNLECGVYGEVRKEVNKDEIEYEIEINGHSSKSGHPILFSWEDINQTNEHV